MPPKKRQGFSIKNPFVRRPQTVVPADTLPPELLQRTATFLSHHDRFVAALVSRSWRTILLSAPLLWCKVSLSPRTQGDLRYVADVLKELFRRSNRLPLTVELSLKASEDFDVDEAYIEDPRGAFKRAIPLALIPQMARIRSLSLQIHEWSGTHWEDVFKTPAPILEQFRLAITCGEDDEPLPDHLFSDFAPRLRQVILDYAGFPENPGPALAGITSFFFDHAHNLDEEDLRKIASWRNLRDLTIAADDGIELELAPSEHLRGVQLRRLQMWPFCDAQTVMNTFPNVQHICFSARLLAASSQRPNFVNPQLLVTVIRAKSAITQSIEIGYREELLPEMHVDNKADLARAGDGPLFAVRMDGHDAVVDLSFADLGRVLISLPVASLFRSMRRLAIPQELFPLFDVVDLPDLDALTLYFGSLPANVPRPAPILERRAHRVNIFRMARVLQKAEDRLPPFRYPAHSISEFIQAKFAGPRVLQRIVLDGFTLANLEEYNFLRSFVPEVFIMNTGSGWLVDDDCGPWKWWFPTEDALRV